MVLAATDTIKNRLRHMLVCGEAGEGPLSVETLLKEYPLGGRHLMFRGTKQLLLVATT
jgi:hypothetical protein